MKLTVKEKKYEDVLKLPECKNQKPLKPNMFWRLLIKCVGKKDLSDTNFTYKTFGMEKLGKNQPCLILMNHSSFIDLEIAETVFFPRPLNIVCTSDGFIGKNWLMRQIGCISTNKFVSDYVLVKNMKYTFEKLKSNVLMFPEASYSFDGTATPLPKTLGKCLKIFNVPVVMIRSYGAFQRSPLYNDLHTRKVDVSVDVKYLLSPEEIASKTTEELNSILEKEFTFDNWKWQQENKIKIDENDRADSLNRVLYQCQCCNTEGKMIGKGTELTCKACGAKWTLNEYGLLEEQSDVQKGKFNHIPDWYKWERENVRQELLNKTYKLESDVKIYMKVDNKAIYNVGTGHLTHTNDGFVLDGCDGKLHYEQKPLANYSLYSDYYWYEIGDVICIGNMKTLYYCFPTETNDIVAKARLATEELFKIVSTN